MREIVITANKPCCCLEPKAGEDPPGYRAWPFVKGWLDTPAARVPLVKGRWGWGDYAGWAGVRLGLRRGHYRVSPGLYALGKPGPESPVLATANFKLSFDVLRREAKRMFEGKGR